MTNSLRDYQRTLAYNLAIWISKFLSNLNIKVAENPPPSTGMQTPLHSFRSEPQHDLTTFLPLDDYVLSKDKSEPITSQMSESETLKGETLSETDRNCPAMDVSTLYTNIQLNANAGINLQNVAQDDDFLDSSSSDDAYLSAR